MITYEAYKYGGYIVIDQVTGKDVYIQTDWDFPSLAEIFGWNGKILSKKKLRAANIKDDNTDLALIYSAQVWLDANEGKTADDPGYFDNEE